MTGNLGRLDPQVVGKRNGWLGGDGGKTDPAIALNDNVIPATSRDVGIPHYTWWDHKGSSEWVAYEFRAPVQVSGVSVYWFDDTGHGECRVPASWALYYRTRGRWLPVKNPGAFATAKDQYNILDFVPVETSALKIVIQFQEKYSGGILEWKVK